MEHVMYIQLQRSVIMKFVQALGCQMKTVDGWCWWI